MNRHSAWKLFLTTFVILGLATAARGADPNGKWKWKFTTQSGQEVEITLTLKAEGDKLTGQIVLPGGRSLDIKDGTFKDDEVSFSNESERNGVVNKFRYKGKVEGDTIKGKTERERDGQTTSRDWEAKREK
ncbi:MAG TPA: hypothetical protein VHV08_07865 [Pirellulales bacterium]|jgi:hypothetical protein|nr:hypothetical protein [Pirellulales bacterium]